MDSSLAPRERAEASIPRPAGVGGDVLWSYAVVIAGIHMLALLALVPWLFSWTGLILMVVGIHLYGQTITICYHRLLAHKSFKTPKWLERTWVVFSLCSMQDTPAKWVANHRFHHRHSDEQPDPHSPLVSFIWSHMGWLFFRNREIHNVGALQKHAPDILQDPFYFRLEKGLLPYAIYVAHAAVYFVAGFAVGLATGGTAVAALQFGLSLLVWGVLVRTVVVWHLTWSVNSLTHLFGYRNYATDEGSRNNWLVALLTFGEGWHNNHHYDQAGASNQHRWWEIDLNYYHILALKRLGLAWDVIPPRHVRASRAAKAEKPLPPGKRIEAGHEPATKPLVLAPSESPVTIATTTELTR